NSATGVAYYDESDNFIGTDFPSNNTLFTVNRGKLNPPQGATKVAYCSYGELIVESTEGDNAAGLQSIVDLQSQIDESELKVEDLDIRVTELEQNPSSKTAKAINWQSKVDARRNELQGEYLQ